MDQSPAGSTVYNTLTKACLGPLPDGTIPLAERRRVADALATQLLFYDNVVCLSDDLSVVPTLVELVGVDYACHLMKTRVFRIIRTRSVFFVADVTHLIGLVHARSRGTAKYGPHDWPREAFMSDAVEAAAWVARRGVPGLIDERPIRNLKEAIITTTSEIQPEPILRSALEGLDQDLAAVNFQARRVGHRKNDLLSLDRRNTGTHLMIAEHDVDLHAVRQEVLNHMARRAHLALPGLVGLDVASTDVTVAHGYQTDARDDNQSPPLVNASVRALHSVMQTLRVPDVGEVIRLGRMKPEMLVALREDVAGTRFRKWYAENVLPDPEGAATAAAELLESRLGKSIPQRVVEFFTGRAASFAAAASASAVSGSPETAAAAAMTAGTAAAVVQAVLGARLADWLFKRKHPLKYIEHLREVSRQNPS